MKKTSKRHLLAGISPWIIIGAVLILVPVFIFMAVENIDKQKKQTTRLLVEKGASLIRSFEAGVRTGAGMHWGVFQIQKLLIEMAQQPDIDYLIVTDEQGRILADSDPSMVGDEYRTGLDLQRILKTEGVQWRQVANKDSADTFEVYRRFLPQGSARESLKDSLEGAEKSGRGGDRSGMIIFVGLNMGPVEDARLQDTRHSIWMAVLFLLIGCAGVISLLLAQGYRTARLSLSRVQAFSDNLVENMPVGILAIDGMDRVISCNPKAEAILGYAAHEITGQSAYILLSESCRSVLDVLKKEKSVVEKEIDCVRRDGKVIPLEVIATELKEETGRLIGYVVLMHDLTELRHLKKEIARSQRLAALGNLAAGVAHEIRNPLSSIKGFATYFRERYRDNADDAGTADIMIQEVDRLNRVITQLLDFARPLELVKKSVSIKEIIRHSLKTVENQAGRKSIEIKTDLPMEDQTVMLDQDRIMQVLLNLYLNAFSAMEQGGVLSVGASLSDGMIRVEIRDTGTGIAKEDIGRIFDPYFTTRPSGTGLGLAIVHKIVEAHGGEITVSSIKGEGTTVAVYLPLK